MKSKVQRIAGYELKAMEDTRKELHMAVQLIGAFPRTFLPPDPTDESASLIYNASRRSLESNVVKGYSLGLLIEDLTIVIIKDDLVIDRLPLEDLSVNKALVWLQAKVDDLGFKGSQLQLDLPYEIEASDFDIRLKGQLKVQQEFATLYHNSQIYLEKVVAENSDAFEIRCWPHHFDIATLIPLEKDESGDIAKSVGVGFSPGDEGVNQPYYYVNIWPNVPIETLEKHKLDAGHWNKDGWSGAVLLYEDLQKAENTEMTTNSFLSVTVNILKGTN